MSSEKIERWDTCEFEFNAKETYENPFQDVELKVEFRHESGKTITVDGFYDGGPVWRVRFTPREIGTWNYISKSSDHGLDGEQGNVICITPTKPYLHGPLRTDGFHFVHADGTRRYLVSTRVSCQFAPPDVWPRVINFLKEHKINRVLFMMGGVAGTVKDLYGKGPDFSRYNIRNFQAIDAFIDTLRRADIIASPYFYYFNDGVQLGLTLAQDKSYIRYGIARFGAYCNVMPVLSNQVEHKYSKEGGQYNLASHTWANEIGSYLAQKSVFGLPVTVHNPLETENAINPSYYTILKNWQFPWAHLMLRQMQVAALSGPKEISDLQPEWKTPVYNARGYARQNQLLVDLRRYGIPIINEEPGYEHNCLPSPSPLEKVRLYLPFPRPWNSQTAETLIPTYWTAITASAYIMWGSPAVYELDDPYAEMHKSKVPLYLRIIHDFLTGLPYWEMSPANSLVSPAKVTIEGADYRTNFCLAKEGEVYLVFSLNGGSGNITLAPGRTYDVIRLNPRTGERTDLGKVDGGLQIFSLPDGNWVLLYEHATM